MIDIKELSEKFSTLKCIVIGDHCLDIERIGKFGRYSREAEQIPVFEISEIRYKPGGAANLAANLAALGVRVYPVGTWGQQTIYGEKLMRLFARSDLRSVGMIPGNSTPTYEKYYFSSGKQVWRSDIVSSDMNKCIELEILVMIELIMDRSRIDFIVVADYDETGKGIVTDKILEMIALKYKNTNLFGTSRERINRFTGFSYLVVNEKEVHKAGRLGEENTDNLVITYGGHGSQAINNHTGALEEEITESLTGIVDTCGAGDTFFAVFSASIMSGYNAAISLKLANAAARSTCRKLFGAATITFEELEDEYER